MLLTLVELPPTVTDMLIALLGICSKEELEEEELEEEEELPVEGEEMTEEEMLEESSLSPEEIEERRQVIKNKILAVGKMSRVFAVLREESESVSELKGVAAPRPSNALANGAEDIKDSITNFGDARKSDIENERLPPELFDAADVEGMEEFSGTPGSPAREGGPMTGILDGAGAALSDTPGSPGTITPDVSSAPSSPVMTPETPRRGSSPTTMNSPGGIMDDVPPSPVQEDKTHSRSNSFRRGHARTGSLGTTMTSPSTRRRSLEGTLQMIRQAMDAKDQAIENLADEVSQGATDENSPGSPGRRGSIGRRRSSSTTSPMSPTIPEKDTIIGGRPGGEDVNMGSPK